MLYSFELSVICPEVLSERSKSRMSWKKDSHLRIGLVSAWSQFWVCDTMLWFSQSSDMMHAETAYGAVSTWPKVVHLFVRGLCVKEERKGVKSN